MPGESYSPNMNLVLPGVGVTAGPDYATDLNNSLSIIDLHDHSSGKGVQITPAGLNISSDLSFQSNNATTLRSVRLNSQSAVLSGASDLNCLSAVGGDLYFNDGSGNKVRITQSGGVAGSPGSISNLTSPASAAYVSASSSFVWQSAASTAANLDAGSLLMRNLTAGSFALTLTPPSLSSNYTLTLPAIPAANSFVTLDTSGNFGAAIPIAAGIGTSNLADASVTTAKVADASITNAKLAASNIQISSSSGTFATNQTSYFSVTNLLVNITTTGRPVMLMLVPDGSGVGAIYCNANGSSVSASLAFGRGTPIVNILGEIQFGQNGASNANLTAFAQPGGFVFIDTPVAGTYQYRVLAKVFTGNNISVEHVKLVARELL